MQVGGIALYYVFLQLFSHLVNVQLIAAVLRKASELQIDRQGQ